MSDKNKKPFDLNKHVARLLMSEPFFASLSRRINKTAHAGIPTAGVRVNPDTAQFEMIYNPEFFRGLTDVQRAGVLKHEFYHLVFEHVTGRKPEGVDNRRWNIAADLAINSHLVGELPEGCCMPGEGPFASMPTLRTAEWYLANMPENPGAGGEGEGEGHGAEGGEEGEGGCGGLPGQPGQSGGQPGEGEGESGGFPDGVFDDHDGWDAVSQEVKDIAKERIKEHIKKAASDATNANSWGTVSADCRKEIMDRLVPKVDWRKVLRYFIKTSQRANKRSTPRKLNKRYAYIHPGKNVRRQANIAISIDQSGSVSDALLNAFFNELNSLAKLATFTVIPFDSDVAVDEVYEWKKGETKKWRRVRYGGTDFNPPTEYVNKGNYDGHIVLTDMMAPKPKASRCQRMWMTTPHYAKHPYFQTPEKIIAVEEKTV